MALSPADHPSDGLPGSDTPSGYQELYGPFVIILDDSSGQSAFVVKNSAGSIIFKIDSSGEMFVTGAVYQADSISL